MFTEKYIIYLKAERFIKVYIFIIFIISIIIVGVYLLFVIINDIYNKINKWFLIIIL